MNTHILFSVTFFFENGAVYEIMWTNIVESHSPHMTLWGMRISHCLPTVTNTLSDYIILMAFLLQQWLHERASWSRCTYTACLVLNCVHHFPACCTFFRLAPYTYVNWRWIPMAELYVIHKPRITLWTTSREGFLMSLSARIDLSPEQQNLTLTPSLIWYSYYKWHLVPKNKTFVHPTGTNWLTFLNMLWSFKHLTLLWYHEKSYVNSTMGSIWPHCKKTRI